MVRVKVWGQEKCQSILRIVRNYFRQRMGNLICAMAEGTGK